MFFFYNEGLNISFHFPGNSEKRYSRSGRCTAAVVSQDAWVEHWVARRAGAAAFARCGALIDLDGCVGRAARHMVPQATIHKGSNGEAVVVLERHKRNGLVQDIPPRRGHPMRGVPVAWPEF